MELFNKLEDVISFVLTSHGKEQLATGTFVPAFYAFSDSDIMYDPKRYPVAHTVEELALDVELAPKDSYQNRTIEDLLGKVRPKTSVFPSTSGDNNFGDNFFKVGMLGTSELGNPLYPAFEVKLYDGKISGSAYVTGTFLNQNVPTVYVDLNVKFDTENHSFPVHETLFLEVNELNGIYEKENFEYSILRRYPLQIKQGALFPIYLYTPDELLEFVDYTEDDTEEVPPLQILPTSITNSQVEYWLDIDVDQRIEELLDFDLSDETSVYLRPENVEPSPENC